MKKLFSKAKASVADLAEKPASNPNEGFYQEQLPLQDDAPPSIRPPTQLDVLRYRYHHGANLGGIFVLEQWLYGSMFDPEAKGGSELDAVTAYVRVPLHPASTLIYAGVQINRCPWRGSYSPEVGSSLVLGPLRPSGFGFPRGVLHLCSAAHWLFHAREILHGQDSVPW